MRVLVDDREVLYDFEHAAAELELAYAVTVHKSQGNEFTAVIMPVFPGAPQLSYRNLLYTGITRAKKLLVRRPPQCGRRYGGERSENAALLRSDALLTEKVPEKGKHEAALNRVLAFFLSDALPALRRPAAVDADFLCADCARGP